MSYTVGDHNAMLQQAGNVLYNVPGYVDELIKAINRNTMAVAWQTAAQAGLVPRENLETTLVELINSCGGNAKRD